MAILEMSLIRKWSGMEHARNDSEEFSGNNSNFEIILELPPNVEIIYFVKLLHHNVE